MIELRASLIKAQSYGIEFSFGEDSEFRFNLFQSHFNPQNPLSVVQDLRKKLHMERIHEILEEHYGEDYYKVDMENFIKSLILFIGTDEPKWAYRETYDDMEYLLKPVILE